QGGAGEAAGPGGGAGAVAPTPVTIAFRLATEPAGAEVEVGGVKVGKTPVELPLEKAKLPLVAKFTRDGYEPKEETLTDATPQVTLTLKKKSGKGPGKGPTIKTTR
ncbi:MAG: PEGA domain-containing protein, partial [Deltaproteobacteria bacterium]|nr:PEGA domain-containing protein [Deltaproteobacteria bacterium]